MAKNKKAKRISSGPKKEGSIKANINKVLFGVVILLVLVIGAGFLADYLLFQKQTAPAHQAQKQGKKESASTKIVFEVYPKSEEP